MAAPDPSYVTFPDSLNERLAEILRRIVSIEEKIHALDMKFDRQLCAEASSGSCTGVASLVAEAGLAVFPTDSMDDARRSVRWEELSDGSQPSHAPHEVESADVADGEDRSGVPRVGFVFCSQKRYNPTRKDTTLWLRFQ